MVRLVRYLENLDGGSALVRMSQVGSGRRTILPHSILSADASICTDYIDTFAGRVRYGCFEQIHLIRPFEDVAGREGCILSDKYQLGT